MKQKLAAFMYGRYGFDELGQFLIIVYFIVALCTVFIPNFIARIVVNVISLVLLVFIFYGYSPKISRKERQKTVSTKRGREKYVNFSCCKKTNGNTAKPTYIAPVPPAAPISNSKKSRASMTAPVRNAAKPFTSRSNKTS